MFPMIWSILIPVVALVLLFFPPVRRNLITRFVLPVFKKIMPPISPTEREALDAGSVWWERSLFSGKPDWRGLHSIPAAVLTEKEKAFIEGPAQELALMLDDWEITDRLHNLPEPVWKFIKDKKFFGMIIPEEYGGLGFSAFAHSEVLIRIASRSVTAAVTVMVPNSLGPAELLLHYGTEEQKNRYLPGLADGTEVPCFALTEKEAGSDAASMLSTGVVEKRMVDGKEVVGLHLNWSKRYITLSPIATVVGLAFHLYDPDHLIGDTTDRGITVALIPASTPGVIRGRRHDPISIPFMNGPIEGKDVFVGLDVIVGGVEYAGKGWLMLMERLGIGRGISLPALSTAAAKLASRATGGYARVRRQFHLPVSKFEGVEEALSEIAATTYAMDATRRFTAAGIMQGEAPVLASAIAKYNLTERMRIVVNRAMDIQGGAAIIMGPRNFMGRVYQSIPLGITVEGANILTRSLIVFGQGLVRAHPWVLKEMLSSENPDHGKALKDFDRAFFGHVFHVVRVFFRTWIGGLTAGIFFSAPGGSGVSRYYRGVSRLSTIFALVSDTSMALLGGNLKRKEKITGRMADAVSNLFIVSATLKHFKDQGSQKSDLPLMAWSAESGLYQSQEALLGVIDNLPLLPVRVFLRCIAFPWGRPFRLPSDHLGAKAANVITTPSETRDRLTEGLYKPTDTTTHLGRIEEALQLAIETEDSLKRIYGAIREGKLPSGDLLDQIASAKEQSLLSEEEAAKIERATLARREVVAVDDFAGDYWSK